MSNKTPFTGRFCYASNMTYSDIKTLVYQLTSTNSSSFPDATLVVSANNALDRVTSLIMASDGRWQFDDTNQTDFPIATTDVVQNQQDYALSTSHLEITRAEIKDTDGNWHKLTPIDQTDVYNQSLTDFMKTPGVPMYYDKIANSVFLYPIPNYSQDDSLKLYFERGPSYFASNDTTKTPGFNSLFHDLVAFWTAYNFAISNGKSNANMLMAGIQQKEEQLREYYSLRAKDDHVRVKARPYRYR